MYTIFNLKKNELVSLLRRVRFKAPKMAYLLDYGGCRETAKNAKNGGSLDVTARLPPLKLHTPCESFFIEGTIDRMCEVAIYS